MLKEPEILNDYLEGYRAWRVVKNRLYSLLKAGEYPRGVAVAECNSNGHYGGLLKTKDELPADDHVAPDKKCTCGLYASWDKNVAMTSELTGIAGKVKGWGKSYLASGGWRSEHQMIEYIYSPICQACSAHYRYGIIEANNIHQATTKLQFDVALQFYFSDTIDSSEYSSIDLDEFLCDGHVKNISENDAPLIQMMLLAPESPLTISIESIDVKDGVTDNKYMKDLRDLSNYYEVDIKEFNHENN